MWYVVDNIESVDSPALVIYPDIILDNINLALGIAGGVNKLRPHVKTNKTGEVCEMMMKAGISKFKCATIAEAEMLGMIDAPDVLLAYQPVGAKMARFVKLAKTYQKTHYSCLVDNKECAKALNDLSAAEHTVTDVLIDLNIGMNRTGIQPEGAVELAAYILSLKHLRLIGLHGYDGHIHEADPVQRQRLADAAYAMVEEVHKDIQSWFTYQLLLVVGGTPTFPMHVHREHVECSPGTFVFWDWGYKHLFADMPFNYAAVLITRVISIIDKKRLCVDLGYKAVASENPLPRVHFLNAPDAVQVSQSEEHLVLEVPDTGIYSHGDVFYAVPVHICPTVALYDKAFVARDKMITEAWNIIARNRYITI
ncbi:D-serine deaminase-like pyridoxal phosphate-dependent protein [Parabacteroides sp. PH5-13]|uniref:D-TA family PLP-dependent enzyme n=1 Tax=unclassified Parabacteroides TaxID=2649774 RepID=UPI0024742A8A|nr:MULTISPECIES: D-TA family PLP-dependent enzyme [unclassified Parabacteroides]MDH6305326.1 D-serine deaminase-like pyridoxal phosphate-dependent protein [Parabacteroides sp. PH5-39]MDH6320141.1 D-serine deaminase-like pyridoxal phosphate-dependent protein [Parabacteroides sp. PH5-13]MDH6323916.1 D-serine deaminase-like pyridoxal phosphate-dependent protein [Parabacteroides sp. PH5-8]MDH6385028.1 D-serine deaminase-like pyridoxal phosphate-dependent protein [Parabacteroides sp. PH5-17]MDH6394